METENKDLTAKYTVCTAKGTYKVRADLIVEGDGLITFMLKGKMQFAVSPSIFRYAKEESVKEAE